jgi:hypothetical protein
MTDQSSRPPAPAADSGAYIGSEDEFAVETMPAGPERDEVMGTLESATQDAGSDSAGEERIAEDEARLRERRGQDGSSEYLPGELQWGRAAGWIVGSL